MAEAQPAEQRIERLHERAVRAPVDGQRAADPGGLRRLQVGIHVGAAEGVDRLLGVGDQDQRRLAAPKGHPQDHPLVGIGVLELVDEHDPKSAPQLCGRGCAAVGLQRRLEADHKVIEGHHPQTPFAVLELFAGTRGQAAAHCAEADVLREDRHAGMIDRRPRDPAGVGAVKAGRRPLGEAADVEVVDYLLSQLGEVLDEGHVGFEVAGDPEAAEHLLAEAVGGGDRRPVETRHRTGQVTVARLDRGLRAVGEQLDEPVGAGEHSVQDRPKPTLGGHHPLAHAVTQLTGGDPGEGDQQQLLQRYALGHVAGGQRGDRVRLTGPGAGFEHGHAAGQRTVEGKRLRSLQARD